MIPLVKEEDLVDRKKEREKGRTEKERFKKNKIIKKKEKPIAVLRIRYYEKASLPSMDNGRMVNKAAFAINRGLESLLRDFYFNVLDLSAPPDCIYIEEDARIGANYKFLFIEISKEELPKLKRQLENPTTIYAFNKGDAVLIEGTKSYLSIMWDMPKIWR